MIKFFAALFIFSSQALADVVFVDLNNVYAEINAVQQELAKRNPPEKLILLPLDHKSYADRANASMKLKNDIEKISERYSKGFKTTEDGQDLQTQYLKLKSDQDAINKTLRYNPSDLKKDLSQISSGSISSVMISGHHVKNDADHPSQFFGAFGNIPVSDMLDSFKDFSARNDVSSIYLLGCRSAIPEDLGGVWKAAFPKANYIVGYENTGYLQDNPASHEFIRKTMASEKSILASRSAQEAIKKFQAISPKSSTYGTAACLTLNGSQDPIFISSTKKESATLASELGCSNNSEKVRIAIDYMKCVDGSAGESSACPFKDISKTAALRKECSFQIKDQLDEAAQFRSRQKVLENLLNSGAKVNFASILAKAPESLKKDPDFIKTPVNLNEAKRKIEMIQKALNSQFESSDIYKENKTGALNDLAANKYFVDQAYLAVSNLDIAQYNKLVDTPPPADQGGILRAQAFQQTNPNPAAYKIRIQQVQTEISKASGGPIRAALRKELDTLEAQSSAN